MKKLLIFLILLFAFKANCQPITAGQIKKGYGITGDALNRLMVDTTVITGGGGGSQTPWTSDIDADGFDLNDVGDINVNGGGFFNGGLATLFINEISPGTGVTISPLAGVGTRMVTALTTGELSTSAIPTGTVTSVGTGLWLSGGPITTTGTIISDSASMASYLVRRRDSTITFVTPSQLSSLVTGVSSVFGRTGAVTAAAADYSGVALTGVTSLNGLVVTPNTGAITTGVWNGTDVAVADGGTGASTSAAARTNLTTRYVMTFEAASFTYAASTSYFFGVHSGLQPTTTANLEYQKIPISGVVREATISISVGGTLGTAGVNSTFAINQNNTTLTTISSTVTMSAIINSFAITGMSLAVSANDNLEIKVTTGAFLAAPSTARAKISLYIE